MFPPSLGHTLNGNTFGDTQGDFLSNNKTRISIRVGSASKRALKARRRPSAAPCRESPQIPIAHINELSFVRSRIYGSELVASDDYHIHAATYRGKVVVVKVYQGMDSAKRLEADLKITSSLIHPTMLRPAAVFTATETPFVILGGNSSPMVPNSLGGFKSLTCCLADALGNSELESLMLGAQLLRDISSGLDHISSIQQTIGVSRLTFDLLVDENGNICITVGSGEEDETGGQGYLDVFHNLCTKSFLEANNECHFDKSQAPTTEYSASGSSSQRDLQFSPAEDEAIAETDLPSDLPPTPPRREYVFVPDPSHQSLREISTSYARFMRSLTKQERYLRRKGRSNSTIVAHRCPGYRRDEVTLSPSVLRTAIIQHLTPSLREICQVCHQLVEDGTFDCFCGQEDDGSSPTIQCSRCLVWSHHRCQRNDNESGHQPFTCFSCQESINLATETADDAALSNGRRRALGKCQSCNIRETPEWRRGPNGARTLCNVCGLHYAMLMRKRMELNARLPAHIDLDTLRASARAADQEKNSFSNNHAKQTFAWEDVTLPMGQEPTPGVTTVIVPPATRGQELTAAQQNKLTRDREYLRRKRAATNRSSRIGSTGSLSEDEVIPTSSRRSTNAAARRDRGSDP